MDTDEKRRDLFIDGLTWRIRAIVMSNPAFQTYDQVVNTTLFHCQDHRTYLAEKGERKGRDGSGQGSRQGNGKGNGETSRSTELVTHGVAAQGEQPPKRQRGYDDRRRQGYQGQAQFGQGQQGQGRQG